MASPPRGLAEAAREAPSVAGDPRARRTSERRLAPGPRCERLRLCARARVALEPAHVLLEVEPPLERAEERSAAGGALRRILAAGRGVLLGTRDELLLAEVATHVLIFLDGEVLAEGSPESGHRRRGAATRSGDAVVTWIAIAAWVAVAARVGRRVEPGPAGAPVAASGWSRPGSRPGARPLEALARVRPPRAPGARPRRARDRARHRARAAGGARPLRGRARRDRRRGLRRVGARHVALVRRLPARRPAAGRGPLAVPPRARRDRPRRSRSTRRALRTTVPGTAQE